MERQTGNARLTGSPPGQGSEDELMHAVRLAAAAEYEILGEMGRGERGSVVYLARERATRRLVALKLRPDGGEYELSVLRELDATVPAVGDKCPACGVDLLGWGRFCSHCGKDLSDTRPGSASPDSSREERLAAVQSAAGAEYEVLGEMERSEGGGVVYFAREQSSGRLVGLRLTRESHADGTLTYALDVAQVIKPLVASLGATYASPAASMPGVVAPAWRAAPSPRSPQPAAKSAMPQSVMVPDDLVEGDEALGPTKRLPRIPLAIAGAIVLLGGGLYVYWNSTGGVPDATQDAPAGVVVAATAPVAAAPVSTASKPDSGNVVIASPPTATRAARDERLANDHVPAASPKKIPKSTAAARRKGRSSAVAAAPVAPSAPNCLNAYGDKRWPAAVTACTREANAGNQQAQRNLGALYDQGLGVSKDAALAASWYRKAASTGNRDALFQLATMYEQGRGVPQDQKQALDWYRKAAFQGDGDSQVKLGRAYLDGKGVEKNDAEAAAWFQRAADQGNLYALNRLGGMYVDGKGVRRDEARGAKLFQTAAAKNDAQGQYNLATMYAKGRGVARSDSTANDLYLKAAKQGYDDAMKEARRRNLKF